MFSLNVLSTPFGRNSSFNIIFRFTCKRRTFNIYAGVALFFFNLSLQNARIYQRFPLRVSKKYEHLFPKLQSLQLPTKIHRLSGLPLISVRSCKTPGSVFTLSFTQTKAFGNHFSRGTALYPSIRFLDFFQNRFGRD